MTTNIDTIKFRGYLVFSNFLVFGLLFFFLDWAFNGMGKELYTHRDVACNIVSTFSIALVGILAGIVVLVTSLSDSAYTRYFKEAGHRGDYLTCYVVSIGFIFFTHCSAILALSNFIWFKIMITSMMLNIIQAILLAISAYSISHANPAECVDQR